MPTHTTLAHIARCHGIRRAGWPLCKLPVSVLRGPYVGEGKLPDDPGPTVPFLMLVLLSSAVNVETIWDSRATLELSWGDDKAEQVSVLPWDTAIRPCDNEFWLDWTSAKAKSQIVLLTLMDF